MDGRPATDEETGAWNAYRSRCRAEGGGDIGPVPEQWPADPSATRWIMYILRSGGCEKDGPDRQTLTRLLNRPV